MERLKTKRIVIYFVSAVLLFKGRRKTTDGKKCRKCNIEKGKRNSEQSERRNY